MYRKYLSFYDLHVQINQEVGLECLCWPGVFGVRCNPTARIIIIDTDRVLFSIGEFFKDVLNGSIKNEELLKDLQIHGEKNFSFFILAANYELENGLKRKEVLNFYNFLYFDRTSDDYIYRQPSNYSK